MERLENNVNQNYDFFFCLGVMANLLQIENYEMLLKDTTNNNIMKELQTQDKILAEQTNIYLKKIIKQNDKLLQLLDNKN